VSNVTAAPNAARELAAIVGEPHVIDDAAGLAPYTLDGVAPSCVVSPGSPEEVAAVLRLANQQGLAIAVGGGFTRQHTGATPEQVDIVLRTTRLTPVEHYDPGDLTIGIGAGATIAEVERIIGPHAQMLPLDIGAPESATIGGVLATADHGALKHGYGGAREFCIGVRFVTGDGKIAKGGGRVVKNVAGYDLMKLLIGSYGTLGVIVGASFKVFPRPRQMRTFVSVYSTLQEALAFRDRVQDSSLAPMCLEIVSPHAAGLIEGFPKDDQWRILLRAGGSDAVLNRYRRDLGAGQSELEGDAEALFWHAYANFRETAVARARNSLIIAVGVPGTEVATALKAGESAAVSNGFVCAAIGRCAVGSLLLAFLPLAVDPPGAIQYVNAISALRAAFTRDGSAVVQRCPLEAKSRFSQWGSASTDLESMRAVKRALDPNDILNRGRFLV